MDHSTDSMGRVSTFSAGHTLDTAGVWGLTLQWRANGVQSSYYMDVNLQQLLLSVGCRNNCHLQLTFPSTNRELCTVPQLDGKWPRFRKSHTHLYMIKFFLKSSKRKIPTETDTCILIIKT